jgi:hypothetical protein
MLFNFGLKSVILNHFNGWIIGFVDGGRGVKPADGKTESPAFFKHDDPNMWADWDLIAREVK